MDSAWGRFTGWLKRLEARGDAWAAKRLTPEEYADAVVLDRRLKANFWRWLGYYAAVSTAIAAVLVLATDKFAWPRALFIANAFCVGVLMCFLSAWYGYTRYVGKNARRHFVIFFLMLLAGGAVGLVMATLDTGRPLSSLTPEKFARTFAVAMLVGGGIAVVLAVVARLRSREVQQRVALLEAEAGRERLARQGAQAELKLLQAQVEPHFLFNTLSNLRYLVQSGSRDALPMLDHLIHYLRTALPELRAEGSTVGREAELARAYLEIMKLRMGGALDYAIDVPEPLARSPVPPFMVITLVENAIKHGVAPLGRGRVALAVREREGRIRIEVEDDGRGLGGPIGQGTGLANIRERLRALYGEAATLSLEGREPSGTLAVIEMPA